MGASAASQELRRDAHHEQRRQHHWPLLAPVCPAPEQDQDAAAGGVQPRDDTHFELVSLGDIAKGDGQGRQASGAACAHVTNIGLKSRMIAGIPEPDVERSARSNDTQQ